MLNTPFKPWRPICVRNQAQNPAHKRLSHVRSIPSFNIDYMYMTENPEHNQSMFPILVIKENYLAQNMFLL